MNRIKIAFADNHTFIINMTKHYLNNSEDINIYLTAFDGLDLIEQIDKKSIKPDLCLVDISMPRMNGFSAIKHIKQQWPAMKTIAFTGYKRRAYLEELVYLGVNSYIRKDIHPQELIRAIKEVHDYGIYYNGDFNLQFCRSIIKSPSPFHQLTEMERRILYHIIQGSTYNEISKTMNLSIGSIEAQRRNIFNTINIKNKVDLVSYIIKNGYSEILNSYFLNP